MTLTVRHRAMISFLIFVLVLIKQTVVNELKILNPYAPANRLLSWLIILPLAIVAFVFSTNVLLVRLRAKKISVASADLLLALPMLLYLLLTLLFISFGG
jgi:hypothetical protein